MTLLEFFSLLGTTRPRSLFMALPDKSYLGGKGKIQVEEGWRVTGIERESRREREA